jgi:twitching motility protein PilT
MPNVQDFLHYVVDSGGSDMHIKVGGPPCVRVNGSLIRTEFASMTAVDCQTAARELMTNDQISRLGEQGEVDFAYSIPELGRFRVNVFHQRGSLGMAIRRVLPGSPSFATLGLPPSVQTLAEEQRGMLLVTGPTSSGKTTTTGAIIDHINNTRQCHILTIEDPIEILHRDCQAIVNQREIGLDTEDFSSALRAAMRQDPDVIFVGEIRDEETVKAALQAAETGHFVISTLHTTDVTETVNRMIDFFPPHQQKQVRVSLAGALRGIVSQRLLPRRDGRGRIPAVEILVMNGRVRELILNPEQTHLIRDIVAESGFYGMQTFDQSVLALYRAGLIELDDALAGATNSHDFQVALHEEGFETV